MKNIIFLLLTSLLVSSLIVGCGGSSGDGDKKGGNNNTANKDLVGKTPTVLIPGGGLVSTTASAPKTGTETKKPAVTPGCEDKDAVLPGCSK